LGHALDYIDTEFRVFLTKRESCRVARRGKREIIKKVVATDGLGKETAVELLDTEGGVKKISDLKPADYDKVYEAYENEISGGEAGATGDTAAVEFDENDPAA
jgi:hypothetical protein